MIRIIIGIVIGFAIGAFMYNDNLSLNIQNGDETINLTDKATEACKKAGAENCKDLTGKAVDKIQESVK